MGNIWGWLENFSSKFKESWESSCGVNIVRNRSFRKIEFLIENKWDSGQPLCPKYRSLRFRFLPSKDTQLTPCTIEFFVLQILDNNGLRRIRCSKDYFRSFPSGKIIKHACRAGIAVGLLRRMHRETGAGWTGIINNRDNLLETILALVYRPIEPQRFCSVIHSELFYRSYFFLSLFLSSSSYTYMHTLVENEHFISRNVNLLERFTFQILGR